MNRLDFKISILTFLIMLLSSSLLTAQDDTLRIEDITNYGDYYETGIFIKEGDSLPFTGVQTKNYLDTNIIEVVIHYKNGQNKNCRVNTYYLSGAKSEEYYHGNQENVENGNYSAWFENGNLQLTGYTINGENDGIWIEFYENGNIKSKKQYSDNKNIGSWQFWDEQGNLLKTENYKNNKLIETK